MHFVVNEQDLKKALGFAGMFLGSRSIIDVTKGIRLYIPEERDFLIIEASDLERSCHIRVPLVSIKKRGEAVVVGDKLIQAIKHQDKNADITIKSGRFLSINNHQGFLSKIGTMDPANFPRIPMPPRDIGVTKVDRDELLTMMRMVKFGADASGKIEKAFARSIFFDNDLVFATDSSKVAVAHRKANYGKIVIPANSDRLINLMEGELSIVCNESQLFVWDQSFYFVINMSVDNKPPPIQTILERFSNPQVVYRLEKEDLSALKGSIQRALITSSVVTFFITQNKMFVAGITEGGETVSVLPFSPVEPLAQEFIVSYNGQFLLGSLANFSNAEIGFLNQGYVFRVDADGCTGIVAKSINVNEGRIKTLIEEV